MESFLRFLSGLYGPDQLWVLFVPVFAIMATALFADLHTKKPPWERLSRIGVVGVGSLVTLFAVSPWESTNHQLATTLGQLSAMAAFGGLLVLARQSKHPLNRLIQRTAAVFMLAVALKIAVHYPLLFSMGDPAISARGLDNWANLLLWLAGVMLAAWTVLFVVKRPNDNKAAIPAKPEAKKV